MIPPCPSARPPGNATTVKVDFKETMHNRVRYPSKLKDVTLRVGDTLEVAWTETNHVVAIYDPAKGTVPIIPFPPQPGEPQHQQQEQ